MIVRHGKIQLLKSIETIQNRESEKTQTNNTEANLIRLEFESWKSKYTEDFNVTEDVFACTKSVLKATKFDISIDDWQSPVSVMMLIQMRGLLNSTFIHAQVVPSILPGLSDHCMYLSDD